MRRLLILTIAIVSAVCSCTKIEVDEQTQSKVISFDTFVDKSGRAVETTILTLNSAELYSYYTADKEWDDKSECRTFMQTDLAISDVGEVTTGATAYWPDIVSGTSTYGKVSFFAFGPSADALYSVSEPMDNDDGDFRINYVVPNDPKNQQDLVYAHAVDQSQDNSNKTVALSFNHLLSKINLSVISENGVGVDITSAVIVYSSDNSKQVARSGEYSHSTNTWSTSSDSYHEGTTSDLTPTNNIALGTEVISIIDTPNYPMLLPQYLAEGALTAIVEYKVANQTKTSEVVLPALLIEAGKQYNYILNVAQATIFFSELIIDEWGDESNIDVDIIKIYTPEQLASIGVDVAYPLNDIEYILMNDLDLSGYSDWAAIGTAATPFTGKMYPNDPEGITISGLKQTATSSEIGGLIGATNNAEISGITMESPKITSSTTYNAALVGYALNTVINNCDISGGNMTFASGSIHSGGIAGYSYNSNIQNCNADGLSVTATTPTTSDSSYVGLISGRCYKGDIADCTVSNSNITSSGTYAVDIGGVIGNAYEVLLIENCHAENVNISSTALNCYIGGVVGFMGKYEEPTTTISPYTIRNCSFTDGSILASGSNVGYAGGIAGKLYYGVAEGCYNTSEIAGKNYSAGIISESITSDIRACYNTGALSISTLTTYTSRYIGGIVGHGTDTDIVSCYNVGVLDAVSVNQMGGILGYSSDGLCSVSESYYQYGCGKYVIGNKSEIQDFKKLNELNTKLSSMNSALLGVSNGYDTFLDNGESLLPSFEYDILTPFTQYVPDNYTAIRDRADMDSIDDGLSGDYFVANHIGMTTTAFDPIGEYSSSTKFSGEFDGNNKNIYTLTISSSVDGIGLFAYITTGAMVKNSTLVSPSISGVNRVGGFAGFMNGSSSIIGCGVSGGTIKGSGDYIGGIVGRVYQQTSPVIESCFNAATISGTGSDSDYVGGIIGDSYYSINITGCYNTGSVTASDDYAGGIIGYYNSSKGTTKLSIQGCYNAGTINADNYYCGIAGYSYYCYYKGCYNTGKITNGGLLVSDYALGYGSYNSYSYNYFIEGSSSYLSEDHIDSDSIYELDDISDLNGKISNMNSAGSGYTYTNNGTSYLPSLMGEKTPYVKY